MTIARTALVALATTLGTVALAGPASATAYPRFTPAWPAKWYPAQADAGAAVEGQDILIWVPPPS